MVVYTIPQQRRKEESERLRGESDQIKFIVINAFPNLFSSSYIYVPAIKYLLKSGYFTGRFKGQPGWVPRAHLKSAVHLDLSKQTLSVGIVKDRESLRNAGKPSSMFPLHTS